MSLFCEGLNGTLTIPAGVTSIGDMAFLGCSGVTKVTFVKGVEDRIVAVGSNAFCSTGITSVEPAGLTFGDVRDDAANGSLLTAETLTRFQPLFIYIPLDDTIPNVSKVTPEGDTVFVSLCTGGQTATAVCAVYNGDGQMTGVRTESVTGVQDGLKFQFTGTSFTTVKVFLLDAHGAPLCKSKGA